MEGASVTVSPSFGRCAASPRFIGDKNKSRYPRKQGDQLLLLFLPHPDLAICESMRWQRQSVVRDRAVSELALNSVRRGAF